MGVLGCAVLSSAALCCAEEGKGRRGAGVADWWQEELVAVGSQERIDRKGPDLNKIRRRSQCNPGSASSDHDLLLTTGDGAG